MAVDRTPVLKRCRSLGMDPIYLGIDKKSTRQLKEDWICACPCSTFFLTRRFVVVFLVVFAILKLTYAFLNQSKFIVRILNYFFLFATVLFGPLRVLALVLVF